jgi:hypothetical protein
MNKEQFDQEIGEVPPSTVDVEAVIARGRRAAWVRRAANPWVAAAAGVVAITFGVAVAVIPGSDPGGAQTPLEPPESSTSSAAPAPPPLQCGPTATVPPAPEQPVAAAARLTGVLTAAVQARLPAGTELKSSPAGYSPQDPPHGPLEFVHYASEAVPSSDGGCQGGADEFLAGASTVLAGKTGSIQAVVARLGGHASPTGTCDDVTRGTTVGFNVTCTQPAGPNGEIIIATTMTPTGPGSTVHRVDVTKPDGTGVILLAANSADPKRSERPASSAPPFTHQQLIEIALDPGMTLYP